MTGRIQKPESLPFIHQANACPRRCRAIVELDAQVAQSRWGRNSLVVVLTHNGKDRAIWKRRRIGCSSVNILAVKRSPGSILVPAPGNSGWKVVWSSELGCRISLFRARPGASPDKSASWTRASMYFPGLKVTTCFSGTMTSSPVRGFLALRAALGLTSNTPKFLQFDPTVPD